MTLNEAIREGGKKFPRQVVAVFSDGDGGACVNGALAWSLLGDAFGLCADLTFAAVRKTHPEVEHSCACPAPGCFGVPARYGYESAPLLRVMAHLNNDHGWSREAIAEWADPRPDLHVAMPSLVNAPLEPTVRCVAKTGERL